jgi:hypothetical protein
VVYRLLDGTLRPAVVTGIAGALCDLEVFGVAVASSERFIDDAAEGTAIGTWRTYRVPA